MSVQPSGMSFRVLDAVIAGVGNDDAALTIGEYGVRAGEGGSARWAIVAGEFVPARAGQGRDNAVGADLSDAVIALVGDVDNAPVINSTQCDVNKIYLQRRCCQ
jgi:hypothetical protein